MTIALYQQFRDALDATPMTGRFMPYGWVCLPNPLGSQWIVYSQMLHEFARELANIINTFTHHTHQLRAWSIAIDGMSDDDRLEATHTFIDTLATNALNLPYVVKSRFGFAAAHLCHQANMLKCGDAWVDDLPLDGEIFPHVADQYGKGWRRYARLKRALDATGARAFQDATGNFRNTYNHRFSPRFVIGMTQMVTRRVDAANGRVSYGLGGREPLDLGTVAALVEAEQLRFYTAFNAFQALANEQIDAIAADEARRRARCPT